MWEIAIIILPFKSSVVTLCCAFFQTFGSFGFPKFALFFFFKEIDSLANIGLTKYKAKLIRNSKGCVKGKCTFPIHHWAM